MHMHVFIFRIITLNIVISCTPSIHNFLKELDFEMIHRSYWHSWNTVLDLYMIIMNNKFSNILYNRFFLLNILVFLLQIIFNAKYSIFSLYSPLPTKKGPPHQNYKKNQQRKRIMTCERGKRTMEMISRWHFHVKEIYELHA